MSTKTDNLTKARDEAGFLVDDLRAAHSNGNAIESLILLPMIYRAADLLKDINALLEAILANDSEAYQNLNH